MSQVTEYASLYPDITLELPGCSAGAMLHALQRAGRMFCEESRAFRMVLDPLPVVNYQGDYNLGQGKAHPYAAQIDRIISASINGVTMENDWFTLWEGQWLRLASEALPMTEDIEQLLICGVSPKILYTNWTGVTDGSATFSVNGSTYEATALDFSACASMDDVARVIETGARTAAEYEKLYVKWDDATSTRFLIWAESAELSYLTAGTTGTDISGALYINGLTGCTGVRIAPQLLVEAVLVPDLHTDVLPDWFLSRYAYGIAARAVQLLCELRGTAAAPNPFYNPELAERKRLEYQDVLGSATRRMRLGDQDATESLL